MGISLRTLSNSRRSPEAVANGSVTAKKSRPFIQRRLWVLGSRTYANLHGSGNPGRSVRLRPNRAPTPAHITTDITKLILRLAISESHATQKPLKEEKILRELGTLTSSRHSSCKKISDVVCLPSGHGHGMHPRVPLPLLGTQGPHPS